MWAWCHKSIEKVTKRALLWSGIAARSLWRIRLRLSKISGLHQQFLPHRWQSAIFPWVSPFFSSAVAFSAFLPPSPLFRLRISGFKDARSDQHFSGTTTSQCQHFYDMLCVFSCSFIHILIINRERKQNLSVQVILWLSTWPWLVLNWEWENFCSRENTGNQSELRAPSAAWESLLSTFSDSPEDFRAAGIHLGYSHGADNLEAELSIDTALSDRASELWERRFWINPEW